MLSHRAMRRLFESLQIRSVVTRNRIVVSPMCQYSSVDGLANEWHLVHLGARAIGGAGIIFTEAAAISPDGRISPQDLGLWCDAQIPALQRVTNFLSAHGAVPAMQLAHAGRKASTARPWEGGKPLPTGAGGWTPLAPSAIPFADGYATPHAMTAAEIAATIAQFAAAAERAVRAGFQIIELHAAHGYLFHEFLSPLSNTRTDHYGGSFDNRIRLLCETVRAVRAAIGEKLPLFVRLSATDWVEGGWNLPQSIALAQHLKTLSVDCIDCSSGGNVPHVKIPVAPGYQVPFAAAIRTEAAIMTGAVGLITAATQAEAILQADHADLIFLAREFLRDPHWPLHAARELNADAPWPVQYERAK